MKIYPSTLFCNNLQRPRSEVVIFANIRIKSQKYIDKNDEIMVNYGEKSISMGNIG